MKKITSKFGVKGGSNFIHARCFNNFKDMESETNCIAAENRHIGVGYMRKGQSIKLYEDAPVYDNEGGGLTVSVKVIMSKRDFKRKFNDMCERVTTGESICF